MRTALLKYINVIIIRSISKHNSPKFKTVK